MASTRRRRIVTLLDWRDSEDSRPGSEGDRWPRDHGTRGRRVGGRGARGGQRARDRRACDRRARDRRARDRRARDWRAREWKVHDQWTRDSTGAPPKRRRTADEWEGTGQEEEKQKEVHPLGYKALENICKSSSPEDGILELANQSKRFEALLNSKTEIRPDLMKLVIRAVHLCCLSDQVKQHAEKMLRTVIKTNFLLLHLSTFITQISYNSEVNKEFQPDDVILHLAEAFLGLLQRFGRDIVNAIPLAQLSEALEELKTKGLLHDDQNMLGQKVTRVKELKDEIIRRKIESQQKQEDESELEPPQDFRDVTVIPHATDLNIHCQPFLRVNIVGGSYKDLEHYLDVQFRLLREDFILPLRQGIKQLRNDHGRPATSSASDRKHANYVSVYHQVTVLYPVCNGKGMVYRIRFDSSHRIVRHVKWERSKRLKFGSLLCLSADEFYTPLFATVENRDPKELCRGELEVRFEGVQLETLNQYIQENEKFDMVESPAFFEAYRHVLEGLQNIQPHELPFQEHIVKCNRDVGPPEYENKTNGLFVMSDIINDEVVMNDTGLAFDNRMEEDNDDSQSASKEDIFDNWVFREWNSDSADSDWLPTDDESMSEDDFDTSDAAEFDEVGMDDAGLAFNNTLEEDDDDSQSASTEDIFDNWAFREWRSDSDDSDWLPADNELMPEDDFDTSDTEFASVTSDSLSDDSSELSVDGDLSGVPEDVVNIYDLQLHRESLGFNDSQMRAFKMALSKKIAVIQGPPGTGKTYVGLKIARVLLQSASLWQDTEKRSPILMVSYTNHALDEFLGGVPMEGIVRVGGRCGEKMKCCSLKCRRDEARTMKTIPRRIFRARMKVRDELRELEESEAFQRSSALLKCSRSGILSFQVLKQFMYNPHRRWFQDKATGSIDGLLLYWLDVKIVAGKESKKKHDREVARNEDFEMQVSFRNFANDEDFEDDDEKHTSNPSEVAICRAEDTKRPATLYKYLQDNEVMTEYDEKRTQYDLKRLSPYRRWKLYMLWLQRAEKYYLNSLQKIQPDYEKALARKIEVMQEEDFHVLQNARVIGMTTTCAARYRRILQRIAPKIVLVEEAAEVLEAHIITSLSKGCQHLILIGDHQQLRPTPAVYELAKKYKLDVSLFERMVNVGIPCERLSVQHRMRPEIATLMKHIYKDLENHESVENYEDIKGMKKNMFFVNHSHLENHNDESHSHANEHEAKFLVALCHYLLQQGYSAGQITLLTTYTGQMFAIRECFKEEKDEELQSVRLTTVDNFQGEENDIILLSLVRSNKDEKVGFIKIVNRACVALSRAKKGFYCIGNFDLLSKCGGIWSKIVADLKASGSIGNALPLVCQIHHEEVTVEAAEDFSEKVPDGGCRRRCEVRLPCGHVCKFLCHPKDPEHEEYLCEEDCPNTIKGCSHLCPKLCCQECETDCPELVEKTLPSCGHTQQVRCGMDVYRVQCKERCEKILSKCGHRCQAHCCESCTTKCTELVKRSDWPCGHLVTIACSATPADCSVSCGTTLECGHRCEGKCGECRMGRLHKRCRLRCGRPLVCSHPCKMSCTTSCPPCSLKCENRCVHSHCKKTCGEPCVPCAHKCIWTCPHYKCTKPCGQLCNRRRCDEPCQEILRCGSKNDPHSCRGLCGEPCICAVCERNDGRDPITEIFLGGEDEEDAVFIQLPDCKHIFAVSDLDRYMDISNDDSTDDHVIQLKSCPRCKTAIRRSLRYGNVIKEQLQNIEEVKKKVHGDASAVKDAKDRLEVRLTVLKKQFDGDNEMKEWKRLEHRMRRMSKGIMAAVTENQVTLMERHCLMNQKLKRTLLNDAAHRKASIESCLEVSFIQKELDYLKKRSMSEGVTQRELRDVNLEFARLNLQLELCLLNHDVTRLNLTLDEPSTHVMRDVSDNLSSGKLIKAKRLDELLEKLAAIREAYPALGPLTPEEKKQIVSAVGLKQGHWYKCPKGHIYAIGECGGAMQKSTCPECGAAIGGASHRLEEGNELAPEMDGARHAAWSEQANLQNYVIVDEA